MAPPTDDHRLALVLLDEAKDLLSAVGVRLSVVGVDETRAVVVSEPVNGRMSVAKACDVSRRVLTRVAAATPGSPTELVELRCGRDSEWPCTYSLEWGPQRPPGAEADDAPSLEMLMSGWEPGAAGTGAPGIGSTATRRPGAAVIAGGSTDPDRAGLGRDPLRPGRLTLPPWFKRRWWLLALCVLAGSAGGFVARSAQSSASGLLSSYASQLGVLVGCLIGLVIVVATERADPRADDVEELAHATGTAASADPGPIPVADLERLLARASGGSPTVTLVPLSVHEVSHVLDLRNRLAAAAETTAPAFDVAGPVGPLEDGLNRADGPTVLVVRRSARLRSIEASVQRLELLGRRPVWAVLAVAEVRSGLRR